MLTTIANKNRADGVDFENLKMLVSQVIEGHSTSQILHSLTKCLGPLSQYIHTPLELHESYYRNKLISIPGLEVMVASWRYGQACLPHDHGSSKGSVYVLQGRFVESGYQWQNGHLVQYDNHTQYKTGDLIPVTSGDIHSMQCLEEGGLTLHMYAPPIEQMKVFDIKNKTTLTVSDHTGAWVPSNQEEIISKIPWNTTSPTAEALQKECDLILYTTLYRGGGEKFEQAANTKARELNAIGDRAVVCEKIESKAQFLAAFQQLKDNGYTVRRFHFFGHSGMYGIMFGSVQWPEQFSPFEWKNMNLPISDKSEFYFHACRSGRWFAPFIARTLNVKTFGYHNYTTVSARPDKFVWEKLNSNTSKNTYIIACPGKKSHGVLGSLKKYSQLCPADKMDEYSATQEVIDTTYDSVAEMYEKTFSNIRVRSDELIWFEKKLSQIQPKNVLDIGCGNGSFLNQLSSHFAAGVGVDLSQGMIAQAKKWRKENTKLSFQKIDGPFLPFADNSFDVVMSTLAFRYLDWDPCMKEILRVLKPGGRFLVLDMVAAPVKMSELPLFVTSKTRQTLQDISNKRFSAALKTMVKSSAWKKMLKYNPIRSEHEMKWYLESRFKGQKAELLNVGWNSRIIAFDTGPVHVKSVENLSYP